MNSIAVSYNAEDIEHLIRIKHSEVHAFRSTFKENHTLPYQERIDQYNQYCQKLHTLIDEYNALLRLSTFSISAREQILSNQREKALTKLKFTDRRLWRQKVRKYSTLLASTSKIEQES